MKKFLPFVPSIASFVMTMVYSLSLTAPVESNGEGMYFIDWGPLTSIILLCIATLIFLFKGLKGKVDTFWCVSTPLLLILIGVCSAIKLAFKKVYLSDIFQYAYQIDWGWLIVDTLVVIGGIVLLYLVLKES